LLSNALSRKNYAAALTTIGASAPAPDALFSPGLFLAAAQLLPYHNPGPVKYGRLRRKAAVFGAFIRKRESRTDVPQVPHVPYVKKVT
jgi:hypothetical protein